MVTRAKAMLIAANKSEFAQLPPAGTEWRWGDVVDLRSTGDGMSRSVAQRARRDNLITSIGDGEYVTTRKLDEYLEEKHGIELELTARRDDEQFNPPENQTAGPSTRDSSTNQAS